MSADNEKDIAGNGEFAVGFGEAMDYNLQASAATAIDLQIEKIGNQIDNVKSTILSEIDKCISNCRKVGGDCEACLSGRIDRISERNDQLLGKLDGKLTDAIDSRIKSADARIGLVRDTLQVAGIPVEEIQPAQSGKGGLHIPDIRFPAQNPGSPTPATPIPTDSTCPTNLTMTDFAGHTFCLTDSSIPSGIPGIPGNPPTVNLPSPTDGDCVKVCITNWPTAPIPTPETPPLTTPTTTTTQPPSSDSCTVAFPQSLKDAGINEKGEGFENVPQDKLDQLAKEWSDWDFANTQAKIACEPKGGGGGGTIGGPFCNPETVSEDFAALGGTGANTLSINEDGSQVTENQAFIDSLLTFTPFARLGSDSSVASGWYNFIVNGVANVVGALVNALPGPANCAGGSYNEAVGRRALPSILGGILGLTPPSTQRFLDQQVNYVCPTGILSTSDLTNLRITDGCSEEVWKNGLKLNGDCHQWYQLIVDNQQNRVDFNFAINAYRGEFWTKEEYCKALKKLGIVSENYQDLAIKLAEAIPQMPDILRLMVRDVFDEQVVRDYGYDTDFDIKYQGQAKEWAKRQGMTDEIAKYFWRAHWEIPSPTQLYEMLHRLRPDSGVKDQNGNPIVVTADDVENALKTNDMAPGWVKKLMAVSYLPLGRIDIRRGYANGVIRDDELQGKYQDAGYNEKDAKLLAEFTIKTEANSKAALRGVLGANQLAANYEKGLIDSESFALELLNLGYDAEYVTNRIRTSDEKVRMADQKIILDKARKSFLAGRIDSGQYQSVLQNSGIEFGRVQAIVKRDNTVKSLRDKSIAVSKLCKLVEQGYLSAQDYLIRAVNIGYSEGDAMLMLASCQADIQKRQQAAREKDLAKAQRIADKAEAKKRKIDRLARQKYRETFPYKLPAKKPAPNGVYVPTPADDEPPIN